MLLGLVVRVRGLEAEVIGFESHLGKICSFSNRTLPLIVLLYNVYNVKKRCFIEFIPEQYSSKKAGSNLTSSELLYFPN